MPRRRRRRRRRPGPAASCSGPCRSRRPSAANWIAMIAQRHFHEYGTTPRAAGADRAQRPRATPALNPKAIYRDPMTLDDYFASRMITTPFRLFDCDAPVRRLDRGDRLARPTHAADLRPARRSGSRRSAPRSAGRPVVGPVRRPHHDGAARRRRAAVGRAPTSSRPTSTSPSCTTGSASSRMTLARGARLLRQGRVRAVRRGRRAHRPRRRAPAQHPRRPALGRAACTASASSTRRACSCGARPATARSPGDARGRASPPPAAARSPAACSSPGVTDRYRRRCCVGPGRQGGSDLRPIGRRASVKRSQRSASQVWMRSQRAQPPSTLEALYERPLAGVDPARPRRSRHTPTACSITWHRSRAARRRGARGIGEEAQPAVGSRCDRCTSRSRIGTQYQPSWPDRQRRPAGRGEVEVDDRSRRLPSRNTTFVVATSLWHGAAHLRGRPARSTRCALGVERGRCGHVVTAGGSVPTDARIGSSLRPVGQRSTRRHVTGA